MANQAQDEEALQREAAGRPRSRDLGGLRHLLPFLKPYKRRIAAALAALLLAAAATLVMPVAIRSMIDHGFSKENAAFIDSYFLALIGVTTALGLFTAIRFYIVTWLGERVIADIRKAVFHHVLKLSPQFFEVTRTGEILSRLTADTTLIQTVVGSSLSMAMRNLVMAAGAAIMLAVTSPALAGLALALVPALVLPLVFFGRRVRTLSRTAQDRIAETSADAGEAISAMQTIQAFTHEGRSSSAFAGATERAFAAARARVAARARMTAGVIILVFAGIVSVLWVGARLVLSGDMSAGELSQFVIYAVLAAGSFGSLSEIWGDLQAAAGASGRINEILSAVPAVAAPAVPKALPHPAKGAINFDGVTFTYPSRPGVKALADFSLGVSPGETVALVGPSGAGKTTVFQLLLRFYDPQEGGIAIDGVSLAGLDPRDIRKAISLVPQETVIFSGTVAANIAFGRPEASRAEIERAAQEANAADFIRALPQGFDTMLGERGATLSGGQRQRIAIARALLKDAPILLLDEATSALDAAAEREVQTALERLMAGRTVLIIAHRLATVQRAGRIVVMDGGAVADQGRHKDLAAGSGLYARLAALQFATDPAA